MISINSNRYYVLWHEGCLIFLQLVLLGKQSRPYPNVVKFNSTILENLVVIFWLLRNSD